MDEAKKLELYRSGKWACPPPPCCTARWDDESWIKWIDQTGYWMKGIDNAVLNCVQVH